MKWMIGLLMIPMIFLSGCINQTPKCELMGGICRTNCLAHEKPSTGGNLGCSFGTYCCRSVIEKCQMDQICYKVSDTLCQFGPISNPQTCYCPVDVLACPRCTYTEAQWFEEGPEGMVRCVYLG